MSKGAIRLVKNEKNMNKEKAIEAALSQIDLSAKKGILVTGHSKGPAMPYLAASLLKPALPHLPIENCCFAARRSCHQAFVSH
mgnify:CR=1 FL=1